jgi:hypothetical protein
MLLSCVIFLSNAYSVFDFSMEGPTSFFPIIEALMGFVEKSGG